MSLEDLTFLMNFLGYMKHCNEYRMTKHILLDTTLKGGIDDGIRNKYQLAGD